MEIGVIGSGLSAVGAIRALLRLGHKPIVLDWGETLDSDRTEFANALAAREPSTWTKQERRDLARNRTVGASRIPRKLLFGSDFFYGQSRPDAPVEAEGGLPPFTYALGGFSVGWGGATLPPHADDLADWPVDPEDLLRYCRAALDELPYSAREDGLSLNFPVLRENPPALRPSRADAAILQRMHGAGLLEKDRLVFGQSRLLTRVDEGCMYCGQCMSGCVYGAIYKATDEIHRLADEGKITYQRHCLVREISEVDDRVVVRYVTADGTPTERSFDRLFLAAGAVNSTRIVLSSLKQFDRKVILKSRGGYVMPVLSWRSLPVDWPNTNTQPGIFLEMRGGRLDRWVHVQISTANELLLQRLGIQEEAGGLAARFKHSIAKHLLLMFVNFHSDYAGHYELWTTPTTGGAGADQLHSRHYDSSSRFGTFVASALRLMRIGTRIGLTPLVPLARNNSGSFHVGSSLPMRAEPQGDLETDSLGRLRAWRRVHVVDTSAFPSLPGTTVGLLTMANAMRVASAVC